MADVTLTQQFYADTLDQLVSAMRTHSTGRVHANHTCMLHGCYWVLLAPCLAPRLGQPAQGMARACQRTGGSTQHACLQHAVRSSLPAWALHAEELLYLSACFACCASQRGHACPDQRLATMLPVAVHRGMRSGSVRSTSWSAPRQTKRRTGTRMTPHTG